MQVTLQNINVAAVTAALPSKSLQLTDLSQKFGEREVRRIINSTGIEAVRIAGDLSTMSLCLGAARNLIGRSGVNPTSIDGIVVVTQTPDDIMPGVAVGIQAALGLSNSCVALDINYGCSGYVYGLYVASMLIQSGGCQRVLLCTGDVTTKLLSSEDRHTRLVFGDAASATFVERGTNSIDFGFYTNGSGRHHLLTPRSYSEEMCNSGKTGFLHMSGTEIMNFALTVVPDVISKLLSHCALQKEDISLWALHQANEFILKYLTKVMRLDASKVAIDLQKTGNTGPSSIPLLLAGVAEKSSISTDRCVMCGFGVGLSVAAAHTNLEKTNFFSPVDVN